MHLFNAIENGAVVLRARGVYLQASVHHLGGRIFATYGSGFVRLSQGESTSVVGISWSNIQADGVELTPFGEPRYTGEDPRQMRFAFEDAAR